MDESERMIAVILAAGIGKRLGPVGDDRPPKCLLHLGGQSLLERHIACLHDCGIDDVVVVTGYAGARVDAALRRIESAPRVLTVFNPDYERGSVVSLHAADRWLRLGDSVLVMDADVLYHPAVLRRLVDSPSADALLMDRDYEAGEEPVKVCLRDGVPVEFRKRIDPALRYDDSGESVGFFRFAPETAVELADRARDYVDRWDPDAPHEEAIRDLLLADPGRYAVEDITGLPWIEIDFPQDVMRAEEVILPRVEGQS